MSQENEIQPEKAPANNPTPENDPPPSDEAAARSTEFPEHDLEEWFDTVERRIIQIEENAEKQVDSIMTHDGALDSLEISLDDLAARVDKHAKALAKLIVTTTPEGPELAALAGAAVAMDPAALDRIEADREALDEGEYLDRVEEIAIKKLTPGAGFEDRREFPSRAKFHVMLTGYKLFVSVGQTVVYADVLDLVEKMVEAAQDVEAHGAGGQ